jgi:putative MATE family efflux protein
MRIRTSYAQIWKISAPIIIGSAVQNLIALTDMVFLYYRSEDDFASIGFVGTFYIIVAAIGFGFSRGGQILIARYAGGRRAEEAGRAFHSMLLFELLLAAAMFLIMTYGCYWIFAAVVDSDIIFYKSLEYIDTRRWGVFASYAGVAAIALYSGLARPKFIVIDTFILFIINVILNRALIFGAWGFPEMGIAGAGLASTIAEYVALVIFLIYMFFDRRIRPMRVFNLPRLDWPLVREQIGLSIPIVVLSLVGLGSGFLFFGLVENFGERAMAVNSLVRIVYLILSIPVWGFSSGINTITSNFVGQGRRMAVLPMTWKTAKLCFFVTIIMTLPIVLFPRYLLYPILGDERAYLIEMARPVFWVLAFILGSFSIASIYFNSVIGVGDVGTATLVQALAAGVYIGLVFIVVNLPEGSLELAWSTEILYWGLIFAWSYWYLYRKKWYPNA